MSTPSIRISHPRYHSPPAFNPDLHPASSTTSSSASASPMPIPRARDPVPPPLPPPSHLPDPRGQDIAWQWGNDPNATEFGRSTPVKAGSSLRGGSSSDGTGARHGKQQELQSEGAVYDVRRGSSLSTITGGQQQEMPDRDTVMGEDEDGHRSRPLSSYGLHGEKQLEQQALKVSSHTYDKQMLNSLGGPNATKRLSVSGGTTTEGAGGGLAAPTAPTDFGRRNSLLRPLNVTDAARRPSTDSSPSSTRLHLGGISPGVSPGVSPGAGFFEDHPENSRSATTRRGSFLSDVPPSHRGSYDHTMFVNDDYGMEEAQMSNLHIHDRSPGSPMAGTKRRASSPPRENEDRSSISSASGQSDIYHRRSYQNLHAHASPGPRHQHGHSSVSSSSSYAPRHGSLGSSLGIGSVPSSATSYGSGRVSPCALSPAIDPELRSAPIYGDGKSLHPTPVSPQHQRTLSDNAPSSARKLSADSTPHSRHGSLSQIHGIYICECCPKKPKKFETEEDLRLHESEKQYTCAYCPNRFKNKNEAERHQNSLHLRRHSWACAALSGIEAAFHASLTGNNTDVCGYCGQEFPNPAHWDVRANHLNHVHKYGECNQAKKFFRADHFRQHLKHSHQGTSGKWTNMLETACMKDEPPPEKRSVLSQTPPALMVTTSGLGGHEVPLEGQSHIQGPLITETPAED